MLCKSRGRIVEAYQYTGNKSAPGWPNSPANWLSKGHDFSMDEKTVYIQRDGATIEAREGEYIVKSNDNFFVYTAAIFGNEFEII